MRSRGPLKDLNDSKLIINESKLFPQSSRISLIPFRTFRGSLLPKPVTGQELLLAISYTKPALAIVCIMKVTKKEMCNLLKGLHIWLCMNSSNFMIMKIRLPYFMR